MTISKVRNTSVFSFFFNKTANKIMSYRKEQTTYSISEKPSPNLFKRALRPNLIKSLKSLEDTTLNQTRQEAETHMRASGISRRYGYSDRSYLENLRYTN